MARGRGSLVCQLGTFALRPRAASLIKEHLQEHPQLGLLSRTQWALYLHYFSSGDIAHRLALHYTGHRGGTDWHSPGLARMCRGVSSKLALPVAPSFLANRKSSEGH